MQDICEGVNLVRSEDGDAGATHVLCMAEDALADGMFGSAVFVSPQKCVSDCRIENGGMISLRFSARGSTFPLNEWIINWNEAMWAIEDVRESTTGKEAVSFTNGGYESHTGWDLTNLLKTSPDTIAPVLHVRDIWDDVTVDVGELDTGSKRLHVSAIAVIRERPNAVDIESHKVITKGHL